VIRITASALDQDSPLYPIQTYLRDASHLSGDESTGQQLGKVRSLLGEDAAAKSSAVEALTELLGVPNDNGGADVPPGVLRERLLQTLVDQVLLPDRPEPACIIVEDCHWLDPTSLELLERAMQSVIGRRSMLLLTSRDGAVPRRSGASVTTVDLTPLSQTDVAGMIRSVLGENIAVTSELGKAITQRTDGIPLFVEEVARYFLQTGHTESLERLPDEPLRAIPASLRETLMARLDRCGAAKEVAQTAAVIGRSVRHDLLSEVVASSPQELASLLIVLLEAGLLVCEDNTDSYRFGHALIRDAAYGSLLRAERQATHMRVARAMAKVDPQTVTRQPELYALHLTEGGAGKEASPYWLDAARRSLGRSALTEATRLLQHGIAGLAAEPADADVPQMLVDFHALLGPATIALHGPASTEAQELYGEAFALCETLPDHPSHFPIYWGWWRVNRDIATKKQRAQALLDRAVERDVELLLQAHHCNWATHYELGDYERCTNHIKAGLEIYDAGDFHHHCRLYGNHDPKICALGALAQVHWMSGRPISGLRTEEECVAISKRLGHLGTRVHSMDTQLLHRSERRDHAAVLRLAGELIDFTTEHGMSDHRAKGQIYRGWALAMLGEPSAGVRMLREGLEREREIGTLEDFPIYECLAAEATAQTGRFEEALYSLTNAGEQFKALGLMFWRPEVQRLIAELMLLSGSASLVEADELLAEAEVTAEAQKVPMLGLRVAIARADIARRLGDPHRGIRQLAKALAQVAESDDSPDQLAASAMMDRLNEGRGYGRQRPH
jgi:predicted ATPase